MSGRTSTTRFRVCKESVPEARHHVEELLVAWKLGHLVEPAALIASELATNVVLHAAPRGLGDHFELRLRSRDGVLVLEVTDSCRWKEPELRKPDPEEVGGRGLLLVDALADVWGVRSGTGTGKTVWAHLPVRREPLPWSAQHPTSGSVTVAPRSRRIAEPAGSPFKGGERGQRTDSGERLLDVPSQPLRRSGLTGGSSAGED